MKDPYFIQSYNTTHDPGLILLRKQSWYILDQFCSAESMNLTILRSRNSNGHGLYNICMIQIHILYTIFLTQIHSVLLGKLTTRPRITLGFQARFAIIYHHPEMYLWFLFLFFLWGRGLVEGITWIIYKSRYCSLCARMLVCVYCQ